MHAKVYHCSLSLSKEYRRSELDRRSHGPTNFVDPAREVKIVRSYRRPRDLYLSKIVILT